MSSSTATAPSTNNGSRWRTVRSPGTPAEWLKTPRNVTCAATISPPQEGNRYEVNLDALAWIERMAQTLPDGYVLTIDYGYTRAESVRFPAGTLMGYRRHTAREDVLAEAGLRDITAHVNFTALEENGAACGLRP